MNTQKASAVFLSPTGTTGKAVKSIAGGTGLTVETVDLTGYSDRQNFRRSFGEDEIVIAGMPVYAGRLPKNTDDYFAGLEGHNTSAVAVVMYGNRDYNDALLEMKIRLEERGFVVKAAAAFIGQHTFSENIAGGRPDENDLVIAGDFGRQVMEAIADGRQGSLKIKGDYPYKWPGFTPAESGEHATFFKVLTNDDCTMCHLCIDNCPWGAINEHNPAKIDYTKCSRCLRCLKTCPESAKYIADEKFNSFVPQFEKTLNEKRCEPEIFLPA